MRRPILLGLVVGCLVTSLAFSANWHHPLYLHGNNYWRNRIRIEITNHSKQALEGFPLSLAIGNGTDKLPLVGKRAEAIRVCQEDGTELLFAIRDERGSVVRRGPIPEGSTLTVPAVCKPQSGCVLYIYWNNPSAIAPPDVLERSSGIVNGGVELGAGSRPLGWSHDRSDRRRRVMWSDENPHSGKRCLKTVVSPGTEPSWISSRQIGIAVVPGARYRFSAWVRAENVQGKAGWYIHVGTQDEPIKLNRTVTLEGPTFPWKQITVEFTVPEDADRASIGTVLWGTGTAWFDDARLEQFTPGLVEAKVGQVEQIQLKVVGEEPQWSSLVDPKTCDGRMEARVFNFDDQPLDKTLVSIDLNRLAAQMHGRLSDERLVVTFQGQKVPHVVVKRTLLAEVSVPARSEAILYVYFSETTKLSQDSQQSLIQLVKSDINLVKAPSFEQEDNIAQYWKRSGARSQDNVKWYIASDSAPGLGRKSACVEIPANAKRVWTGWTQAVQIDPRKTYLVAGWLKCRDLSDPVRIHVHLHNSEHKPTKNRSIGSVGDPVSGTSDWQLLAGTVETGPDARYLVLHLTTNATGTLYYDGLIVAPVAAGYVRELQPLPELADRLLVWQVPAVEKVFYDTVPPREIGPLAISVARNEWEPLQLAIRSSKQVDKIRVEVTPPQSRNAVRLRDYEINVCGYVPVDAPSSYYLFRGQDWERKIPAQAAGSDGWAGWWPDPLLPTDKLTLAPNQTKAVWIIFRIDDNTPAGLYHGKVRLLAADGTVLLEKPLTVKVYDFRLPQHTQFPAIYDVRLGWGNKYWGGSLDSVYRDIVQFMAQRRLCPDVIRPAPRFRLADGKVEIDFSEHDEAARWYFDELKLPTSYTPWQFYVFGWAHPPKSLFGIPPYEGEYPFADVDRSKLNPKYKSVYQQALRLYLEHMKQKGWYDKLVLYVSDEPHFKHEYVITQMKAVCDMIHEVDPNIPIYSSTWNYVPEWEGYITMWGLGHEGRVPADKLAEIRRTARVRYTTDGQMCLDTPYCAVERLLPYYCMKYNVEGYEFWGVAWLTYNPYEYGWHSFISQSMKPGERHWIRYPCGDGYLIYPGYPLGLSRPVSSVRLEQAREGVEDYEYLVLLKQLLKEAQKQDVDKAVLEQAQHALNEALSLVYTPCAMGRYSTQILPDPTALYKARDSVASAIEALSTAIAQ